MSRQSLHRLLADSTHKPHGATYQRAFAEIAITHKGRPPAEIVPLLRRAADRALLAFTPSDLREQARAISAGTAYELRIRVT
ncbi:hypothetical protein ACFU5O_24795 [Streptomyces sp. NPDC057445]|uniref:hypothetical protein n=1 Tax=Streptomyces sp. NPDC057445 TaxID=3346136 RepID=UPI0036882342